MIDPYARFKSPLDHDASTVRTSSTVPVVRRRHEGRRSPVTVPANMVRPVIGGDLKSDALYLR